jgi:hypothetical protein
VIVGDSHAYASHFVEERGVIALRA